MVRYKSNINFQPLMNIHLQKCILAMWKIFFTKFNQEFIWKKKRLLYQVAHLSSQSRGFSLFGKDFLSAIERLINSNERKLGPPWFVLFCVEFRRFYTTLVPVSRKNVLFLTSIVEIKHVVFWCVEHFLLFAFSFAYLLYNNTEYRILNRCIENWQ